MTTPSPSPEAVEVQAQPDLEFPELAPDADAAEDQYAGLTPLEAAAAKTHPHISMCRLGWTRMDCVTCADELHQIRKYIPAVEAEVRAAALVASDYRREADVLREAYWKLRDHAEAYRSGELSRKVQERFRADPDNPVLTRAASRDRWYAGGIDAAARDIAELMGVPEHEIDRATALEQAQPLPVADGSEAHCATEAAVAEREIECVLCRTRRATGPCCSSHDRLLCHTCYRITHFVEVCVPHCAECIAEDLPLHLSDLEVA